MSQSGTHALNRTRVYKNNVILFSTLCRGQGVRCERRMAPGPLVSGHNLTPWLTAKAVATDLHSSRQFLK